MTKIGILALQGDFEAHQKALRACPDVEAPLVRTADEVRSVDALILPGGESTTVGKLMVRHGLDELIRQRAAAGMPLYGTCAGLILLARDIQGSDQPRLGLLDVEVARNAFGRQVESFEADIAVPAVGPEPVRGVFIRAPAVTRIGPGVEVLGTLGGRVVAVRQGVILGTAFHPELTDDSRIHRLFAELARRLASP